MAEDPNYIINESTLLGVANAIRSRTGGTDPIQVTNFASQIANNIPSGIEQDVIAPEYVEGTPVEYHPYSSNVRGDWVYKNSKYYKCIADTSGDWDATKWEEVTLTDAQLPDYGGNLNYGQYAEDANGHLWTNSDPTQTQYGGWFIPSQPDTMIYFSQIDRTYKAYDVVNYKAYDVVTHDDELHIANASTSGTWDSSRWDSIDVLSLIYRKSRFPYSKITPTPDTYPVRRLENETGAKIYEVFQEFKRSDAVDASWTGTDGAPIYGEFKITNIPTTGTIHGMMWLEQAFIYDTNSAKFSTLPMNSMDSIAYIYKVANEGYRIRFYREEISDYAKNTCRNAYFNQTAFNSSCRFFFVIRFRWTPPS